MKYYDDKTNAKGAYFMFVAVQVVLLLIVYGFVYTVCYVCLSCCAL